MESFWIDEATQLSAGRLRRFRVLALAVALVLPVVSQMVSPASVGAQTWSEPVDAPVVDEFRPPSSRFGAGNRGLEYGLEPGTTVRSTDDGVVSYVGRIGSSRHLVIDHGSGLRSTYAFISSALVVKGQRISKGQAVAVAGPGFHLTARLGSEYVDPRLLFEGAKVVIRLAAGANPATGGETPGADPWSSLRATGQSIEELRPSSGFRDMAVSASRWYSTDCTPAGTALAGSGEGRVVIQVAGLGSSSGSGAIGDLDLGALGYDSTDVIGFSYGGGCTPAPFGDHGAGSDWIGHDLPSSSYQASDTYGDLNQSAVELADLVDSVSEANPGVTIDLATHSLGGVVGRLALEILAERHPNLNPVGVLLTIDSPHQGTEMATAGTAARGNERLSPLVEASRPTGQFDAISVSQVSEVGALALDPPGAPPDGVTVVAVSGSSDLVVPAESSIWVGATNVIINTGELGPFAAHSGIPGYPEVSREFGLALGGQAQRCVALRDVLASAIAGGIVDQAENLVGVLGGIARWVL